MGLLSPAESECHTHVGFLNMPIPDLQSINLDNWHEVAQPCAQGVVDAGVVPRVDVDFRPAHTLVGTHLKEHLPGVVA